MQSFKANGIDGCFHYYDNNWHYIRKWQHLKEMKSLHSLSKEVMDGLSKLKGKEFPISDHYIGRNISCLIKLGWGEEEVVKRSETMARLIKENLV
jgi:8-amino-3,8-dideoxy-alpha-D-manno-octulosonate transaminase